MLYQILVKYRGLFSNNLKTYILKNTENLGKTN